MLPENDKSRLTFEDVLKLRKGEELVFQNMEGKNPVPDFQDRGKYIVEDAFFSLSPDKLAKRIFSNDAQIFRIMLGRLNEPASKALESRMNFPLKEIIKDDAILRVRTEEGNYHSCNYRYFTRHNEVEITFQPKQRMSGTYK